MKNFSILALFSFLVLLIIPLAITKIPKENISVKTKTDVSEISETNKPKSKDESETKNTEKNSDTVAVFLNAEKKTVTVSFFEYTCGSVAAEMPLSYHEEALKAQAVACFTNALRMKKSTDKNSLNGADISDDSGTHQGYINKEERKAKWGSSYEKYEKKLENAVNSVLCEALTYKDELCVASFFSLCSGTTENAENVWGTPVPYLVSVKSGGDSLSPDYITTTTYTREQITDYLKNADIKISEKTKTEDIFSVKNTSKAGTVLSLKAGNKELTGENLRSILSLKSAVFSIKSTDNAVTFTVKGYGHGVGMSQYGADFMAKQGSTYKEILSHYYKNTEIKNIGE